MSQNRETFTNPQLLDLLKGKGSRQEKKVWERVKEWEEANEIGETEDKKLQELREFRATAIVNFGPEGRHTRGLVTEGQTSTQMLFSIVEYFIKSEEKSNG